MKNAQKKSEKNITSETINKIIPNLNPFELLVCVSSNVALG
jgi:hypothetical protein